MITTGFVVILSVAAGLGTIGTGVACVYTYFKKH